MSSPDIKDLQPAVKTRLTAATAALDKAGVPYRVTSGVRTYQQQADLYANRGNNLNPVAPPGHSDHEKGTVIDIVFPPSQRAAGVAILAQHGLVNTVPNDPVHFGLARAAGGNPPVLPPVPGTPGAPSQGTAGPSNKGGVEWHDEGSVNQLRKTLGLPIEKVLTGQQEETVPAGSTTPTSHPDSPSSPAPNPVSVAAPLTFDLPERSAKQLSMPADQPSTPSIPQQVAPQNQPQSPDLLVSLGLLPNTLPTSQPTAAAPVSLFPSTPTSSALDPLSQRTLQIAQSSVGPLRQAIQTYAQQTGGRNYVKDLVIRYAAAAPAAKAAVLSEADSYGLGDMVRDLSNQVNFSSLTGNTPGTPVSPSPQPSPMTLGSVTH